MCHAVKIFILAVKRSLRDDILSNYFEFLNSFGFRYSVFGFKVK